MQMTQIYLADNLNTPTLKQIKLKWQLSLTSVSFEILSQFQ